VNKRVIISYVVISIVIVAFIVTLIKFGPFHSKVTQLSGVEVRNYQGQNLSSVNDFQENSINGPQYINIDDYSLNISGLVKKPLSFSYDQVINDNAAYEKVVRLNCVEGWAVNILWQGLKVSDLLKKADLLPAADTIIFYAYDGYSTSFPIDYIMNNPILMAYKMNDVTIPPERGYPFQLVAEDKWGYKWIKWITRIEVSDNSSFRGFWENYGYSNDGDLNKDFFD
jgi:DMSO/TMAO reductase YedYZ molybdopterin-dependent catalytic subunit